MSDYVVDASVVVKWYVEEVHSDAAGRLLAGDHQFLAPDLLPVEIANVVWKKVLRGELTEPEGENILRALMTSGVRIRSSSDLLVPAYAAAVQTRCTAYDCLYLALALREGARLITADRRLHDTLQACGFSAEIEWIENAG